MDQKIKTLMVLCFKRFNRALPVKKYSMYFLTLAFINLMGAFTLASANEKNPELSMSDVMQEVSVSGIVTDADGEALPGVNVYEKGTDNGTITDIEGNYSLTVTGAESVLSFSYVGYMSEDVNVGNQSQINITLILDITELEGVVVVGYGTVKKSDVTGALSSVSTETLKEMPVTNVNQALQGRAAGVDVVNTSYGLNSKPEVRIRGNRSIKAKNDPLYVVDGIPIAGNINDLNAGDVVSVEILKDASATAIYGSRGANGVILITTKRGKAGEFTVNYEGSFTFKQALRFYDDMTGAEWMEIARDNRRNSEAYTTPYPNPLEDQDILSKMNKNLWESVEPAYTWNEDGTVAMRSVTADERSRWAQVMDEVPDEVPLYNADNVRTYDWFNEGRNNNALTQNHQFSISGGSEKLTAYFSLGYIDEMGQGVGERFQRISPRLNMDFQVTKWFKVGMSNSFNSEIMDKGEGLLTGVVSQIPISLPYDSSGYLINPTDDINLTNPIRDEELNTHENRVARYLGAYYAEISFSKHFKYRLNVSQDFRHWRNGSFLHSLSTDRFPGVNSAGQSQGQDFHYSVDNLLFYNREFGVHSIGVTLLQSVEAARMERTSMSSENLPYDTQLWYKLNSTLDPASITINQSWDDNELLYSKWQLASFMGRINYGLMDKYLVTASLRYDGSSKFYVDNQWDYFPSVSLAWKAHNESFLQDVNAISLLKLRLGYGTVGQSGTSAYETAGRIIESYYVFGEEPAKGYAPELIQTQDVGWEKTTTTNIGLDFGLIRNRISGSIELYRANTTDLLLDRAIPAITGYEKVRSNVGKTRNEGIEITLNTFNIDRNDFSWQTDFSFFANKEKILELADGAEDDILNEWFIGHPITSYYSYEYDGIWQVKDSALMNHYNETGNNKYEFGQIRVKDIDGNDTINTNDRTIVGNNVPRFSGGFTNRFYYKGFELSCFVFFRVGHGVYSRDGHYFPMTTRYSTPFLVDYYKPMGTEEENADAVHPAPSNRRDKHEDALYYMEASFLKIRHITLSYEFPQSMLSKVHISSLRLSVQAYNPFLFTKYPYLDPEANKKKSEYQRAPGGTSDKGWTFGVKVGF